MNEEIAILKRTIEFKKQLITLTKEEIEDLLIVLKILSREIPDEQEKN